VLMLGAERLRHLATACALVDSVASESNAQVFGIMAQAGLRAMIAQQIANDIGYDECELAYIAALLKDLGKHGQARNAFIAVNDDRERLSAETGAWMAALWNMPARLVEAIRNSGASTRAETDSMLIEIIRWSDMVCQAAQGAIGYAVEARPCEALQAALKLHLLDASESECKHIAESIWQNFCGLLSVMGETH